MVIHINACMYVCMYEGSTDFVSRIHGREGGGGRRPGDVRAPPLLELLLAVELLYHGLGQSGQGAIH